MHACMHAYVHAIINNEKEACEFEGDQGMVWRAEREWRNVATVL